MNTQITYNIETKKSENIGFYDVLDKFTSEFLKISSNVAPVISEFKSFIIKNNIEKPRSSEEYFFEILSFFTYWNIYSKNAVQTNFLALGLMKKLYSFRRKFAPFKNNIDKIRGYLTPLLLIHNDSDNLDLSVNIKNLTKLNAWLESTGEFREEVIRFSRWIKFFKEYTNILDSYASDFNGISNLFRIEAKESLGKYTKNCQSFYFNNLPDHMWKEDYIFCNRHESEYHLSMFGAEIINRALKKDFQSANSRALLLPACMRLKDSNSCKAIKDSLDYICIECSDECNISKLNKIGRKEGFTTHIIPHSTDFSTWLRNFAYKKNIGVIGVACPLNLITGGLELQALEIPSQCLLIDYCGCKNHWHTDGIPTKLNTLQLQQIIYPN